MRSTEPYIIRGHHLGTYSETILDRSSPEQTAHYFRLNIVRHPDAGYVADVMGEDPLTIDRTEADLTKAFDRFASLDPQDPVKITFGEKDAICDCCAIGQHCSLGRINRFRVGSRIRDLSSVDIDDMFAIARFKRIAENLGEQGLVQFEPRRDPDFDKSGAPADSDTPTIAYQEPLITTAAVVRSVLSQWNKRSTTQAV